MLMMSICVCLANCRWPGQSLRVARPVRGPGSADRVDLGNKFRSSKALVAFSLRLFARSRSLGSMPPGIFISRIANVSFALAASPKRHERSGRNCCPDGPAWSWAVIWMSPGNKKPTVTPYLHLYVPITISVDMQESSV